MKFVSLSDEDLQLLKAIRPFMSGKSQGLLDTILIALNVFRPENPEHKINFDALNTLLTIMDNSMETKKNAVIDIDSSKPEYEYQDNQDGPTQAEEVETLLKLLAEKEIKKHG